MKIFIIHGEDTTKSYERFRTFIKTAKNQGLGLFDVSENQKFGLIEIVSAASLFEKERLIVVYGSSNIKPEDLKWLIKSYKKFSSNLIIYEPAKISSVLLNKFPKERVIEEYKIPKIIFTFLESFYPGNARASLRLFHELINYEPAELVFAVFSKHLRDLYWVKAGFNSLPYPSWRKAKLLSQSKKFKISQLSDLIKNLAKIDISVKTSQTNIADSLDLLILNELK